MGFDFVTKLESCYTIIQENHDFLILIYYSHIPTAIIALLMGVFVYTKNKKALINKLLLTISLSFSVWSCLDLLTWISYDSRIIMISWSMLGFVHIMIFFASLYFSYVFIEKRDIPLNYRIIFGILLLPIALLTPTNFNLSGFDVANCEAKEGDYFTNYYYLLGFFIFIWILLFSIKSYKRAEKNFKKQILLLITGVELFLLSFFATGYFSSLIDNYSLLIYGLFSIVFFIGFLSYLIVKHQAFDIKVIAAQFLIVTTWIGVFSQFFIVQEFSNQILTGIILVFVTIFGYMLFKSIKEEVKTSEQLSLASKKLAGLNAKLEELDRAKSEFISIASHQLRTPLTSVKGFTSLILDNTFGKVPVTQKTAVEKVFVNNEKLCLLVEDMLNASRLEAGRLEYELEEADVVSVAKSTIDIIKLYAKSKKLKLTLNTPKEKLMAIIDQRKLSEIISNLVDNAIKYTPKGGVTVTVEKVLLEQKIGKAENSGTTKKNWVRVSVADTGIGMNAKQLEAIFEKFKGGDEEISNNQLPISNEISNPNDKNGHNISNGNGNGAYVAGTGLGVYISRQMAKAMGGRVYATSPGKGKGSTFILELPLVKK